ncbi:MAG: helix-turn-helix domain-containing protein [Planctomycetota bacterium]
MSTLTRKQREIAERERLILAVARGMLAERGYLGLNMDRIAEAVEYSKGTVYQHFASKEDLLATLYTDTARQRAAMFKRAASFNGKPRERVAAIGVADQLFVALNPDHFAVENILDVSDVFAKVSEERRNVFIHVKTAMMDVLMGIVRDAVDAGDLSLPDDAPLCQPLYGMWTQSLGHHKLAGQRRMPPFAGIDLEDALWRNYTIMLDGYQWAPLSSEWDYERTIERIRQEVFADEWARLHDRLA